MSRKKENLQESKKKIKPTRKNIKEEYLEALRKCMGNLSLASEKVGISRTQVWEWRINDPEFAHECEMIKPYVCERAEHELFTDMFTNKNIESVRFYLKCRGWPQSDAVIEKILSKGSLAELENDETKLAKLSPTELGIYRQLRKKMDEPNAQPSDN